MDEGLIAPCGMNGAICSGYLAYQHDVKSIAKQVDLNAGIHPKIVSERLGHSNIGITLDTYSHVLPGLQEAAAERFDKILDEKVSSRDKTLKLYDGYYHEIFNEPGRDQVFADIESWLITCS